MPLWFSCEQSKVEQLAADWKALDGRLRESLPPPVTPWTQHQHVQHLQLGKKVSEMLTQIQSLNQPSRAEKLNDKT